MLSNESRPGAKQPVVPLGLKSLLKNWERRGYQGSLSQNLTSRFLVLEVL